MNCIVCIKNNGVIIINKIIGKCICIILSLGIFLSTYIVVSAEDNTGMDLDCQSAILMEASTGTILYEQNADASLPPASVTKIMTLLLVMEHIDSGKLALTDSLQASDYAASMGGSQVFIEPNESMSVEDLLKSVVISSANDAAVVLAEAISGSSDTFVELMNKRAKELGMVNTNFENPTGLDDNTVNHVTSARDIAIMSRELLKHETILKYTNIWMDTIRDGQFGLTNTNRLIRFYKGANGLKTGSTSKAKFCISATAKRDGMQLIAVIMGSPTRDIRNECARKLLDYGFANYSIAEFPETNAGKIKVLAGTTDEINAYHKNVSILVGRGENKNIKETIEMPEHISAPVKAGDVIGKIKYTLNGNVIKETDVYAGESVNRLTYLQIVEKLLKKIFCV